MKPFFFFVIMLFNTSYTFACPFCGCGNSNFQVGILPTYTRAFVGVRYSYSQFNSLSTDKTQFSHDYFHTTELWGGYQFKKLQFMAFVPYVQSHKLSDDGISNAHGLGDITVLANYKVFSRTHTSTKNQKMITHTLFLGGGIKLRTGQNQVDLTDPAFTIGDFSATPGTGSTDYLLNSMYNYLFDNNGIVSNATYRINTANEQHFQYGNRVYANTAFFHSLPAGSFVIRPSLGLNFILNGTNKYQNQNVTGSGGYILSGMAGLNVQRNKLGLVLNGFLPVAQNLFDGQTHFQSRASAALTFSF